MLYSYQIIPILLVICFTAYITYKDLDFLNRNKPNIKFQDEIYSLVINGKKYKYSDIIDISIDEDVTEFSAKDRYFMGDYGHNRLIADRVIFMMKDSVTQEIIETYRRGQLHKILKHINKFKKLNFDINQYKPPIITLPELFTIIIACIVVYFIIHI